MPKITKHLVELKSIGRNTMLVDTVFPHKYSFSPYQACQHACKYCDGRAEKYYVPGDFETDIQVRQNVPDLLETSARKWRERGSILIGSGVSDPYQLVEAKERIMARTISVMESMPYSVSIMTKSALLLRDIEGLESINRKNGVMVMISLTFCDDQERQIFEPFASAVPERLAMIDTLKQQGFSVGVLAMPFIPFISDDDQNVSGLLGLLKEREVDFVMPGVLTLRPGRQKDLFFTTIESEYPQLLTPLKELYDQNLPSGMPHMSYQRRFYQKVHGLLSELGIPYLTPHYVYRRRFPIYDEIYILLCHMVELYGHRDVDVAPLKDGLRLYTNWLTSEKKHFNRKRSLPNDFIAAKLLNILSSNGLFDLVGNKRLAKFLGSIISEGATFDYVTLSLN